MWGSPGTMLAAAALHELTGEERWLELWRESAAWLRDAMGSGDRPLDAGSLRQRRSSTSAPRTASRAACSRSRRDADDELHRRAAAATRRYAVEEDGLANWPPAADGPLRRARRDPRAVVPRRARHRRLARAASRPATTSTSGCCVAGGELTWRAGPLAKGANLCHGTARQRLRVPRALRAHRRRAVARAGARVRDARRRPGRARTRRSTAGPLHALDGRSRHGALPRRLPRRLVRDPAAI